MARRWLELAEGKVISALDELISAVNAELDGYEATQKELEDKIKEYDQLLEQQAQEIYVLQNEKESN